MNDDSLDPELRFRLRTELDQVQPRHSAPRYLTAHSRPIAWRFAPAVLVASVISMLALTAYVATGSPNPADWGHDVVTIIQSSSTTPTPAATPTTAPVVRPSPTSTPQQKPTQKPVEHESPEPSDDHSGDGSGHDGGGDGGGGHGGGDDHEGSSSDSD